MDDLFNENCKNSDLDYQKIFDPINTAAKPVRELINHMWNEYKPYADLDFAKKLPYQFYTSIWEMYLGYSLIKKGNILIKKKNNAGPDLVINDNDTKIFIEAICPTNGEKGSPNEVKELSPGYFQEIRSDTFELRLQASIKKKAEKYCNDYLPKGFIKKNDPYLIAICSERIPLSKFSFDDIPWILKAVLPIGEEIAILNKKENKFSLTRSFKEYNYNHNQKPVAKTIFFDNTLNFISGIIYTNTCLRFDNESSGEEFVLIKNPYANNPIYGNLNIKEYTVELKEGNIFLSGI